MDISEDIKIVQVEKLALNVICIKIVGVIRTSIKVKAPEK